MLIYLAGPDVFRKDVDELGLKLKVMCTEEGATGLFPMDNTFDPANFASLRDMADAIRIANEDMIRKADAVIANMEPFRGPGMDGGTAYEIGFANALGKPVIGYIDASELIGYRPDYARRVIDWQGQPLTVDGHFVRDQGGLLVEDFGLIDNLMLSTGIRALASSAREAVRGVLVLSQGGAVR